MSERERTRSTKREGEPQPAMGLLQNPCVLFGFPSDTLIWESIVCSTRIGS